ncbi:hypothetical protein ACF0H5_005105 [Mactra antiquata]
MPTEYPCVVAIDFGTTYSGYAFSTRTDYKSDPLRVVSSTWAGTRLISLKAPSCILFRPDRKFDSFGFEAEDKYMELTMDNEHNQWYFFKRFKMSLYNSKDVHRTTEIHDETKKPMRAMEVFASAIQYLKDHAMDCIKRRVMHLHEEDVRWVLTVPAIWDDAAKQFMREAAVKSGIPDKHLVLSLEPEAASMFCKYLPVELLMNTQSGKISCFQPGSKYLVLDAGGGTVDITVHEVLKNGKLKELHKVNGGAWGGTTVDKAFIDFIEKLTVNLPLSEYMDNNKEDFMDMMREFEIKKRSATPNMDSKITFKIPISLFEWYSRNKQMELREAIKGNQSLSGKVVLAGDKMRVDCKVVESFFDKTCSEIVAHMKNIFSEPMAKDISAILMVGGFSESAMLQDAVKKAFPTKRVIIPNEAGLAVLKGAVLFGHDSSVITARIAKYTYGLKFRKIYDQKIHPKERLDESGKHIQGVFGKLVEVGQSTSVEDRQEKRSYSPLHGDTAFTIKLYASPEKNPEYVDDPGCFKVGEVYVDCRNRDGSIGSASVWLVFGGTELEVHAENKCGEKTQASFDFLE